MSDIRKSLCSEISARTERTGSEDSLPSPLVIRKVQLEFDALRSDMTKVIDKRQQMLVNDLSGKADPGSPRSPQRNSRHSRHSFGTIETMSETTKPSSQQCLSELKKPHILDATMPGLKYQNSAFSLFSAFAVTDSACGTTGGKSERRRIREQVRTSEREDNLVKQEIRRRISHGANGEPKTSKPPPEDDDRPADHTKLLHVDGAFSSIFGKDHADLECLQYRVETYYYEEGICPRIARSTEFLYMTLAVISLNAVYLGIDSDLNMSPTLYSDRTDWKFILSENLFCTFFVIELVVRFLAFERKLNCLRDGWFRFDSLLVLLMVLDTWIMGPLLAVSDAAGSAGSFSGNSPFRLLRLLRLTRLSRLARSLPELLTLTKSIIAGVRAVFSSLMFVLLLTYSFAIVLHNILSSEGEEGVISDDSSRHAKLGEGYWSFDSVPHCMWTLLLCGTFMEDTGQVLSLLLYSSDPSYVVACFVFLSYILLSAITVMNMLIGVLCEVVVRMSQAERDDSAIRLVKESILTHLKQFDNGDGLISKEELRRVMLEPSSKVILRTLNIDRLFLLELQAMFFPAADTKVDIRSVMELMLMCRGELSLTVEHMAISQASLIAMLDEVVDQINAHSEWLARMQLAGSIPLAACGSFPSEASNNNKRNQPLVTFDDKLPTIASGHNLYDEPEIVEDNGVWKVMEEL